ncbi:MAG: hypothetical protein GVY15_02595 [Bacteroidetes bacterium]|jgi:hypothetical protein|nr:hypothetical protein [Bacteroidota bacterium]
MDTTPQHVRRWHRFYSVIVPLLMGALLVLGGCAEGGDADDASPDGAAPASDLAALNSDYATTPYEAAFAEVHRIDLPAGASIAPHEGGPRVIYSINAYTMRLETDGTSSERTFEAGAVHYHTGGVHAVATPENMGNETASFMAFERTEGSLPAASSPTGELLDAVSIPEGATHEVPLDNEDFTVHRIALEPGASLPSHYGYPRIIYALTDYTLTFIDPDSDARTERSFAEGDLHDHEAGMHAVENTGAQRAEYLVVAFKR